MAVLQFLDFTFDTENGELTRGGEEVTLQRKAKQVLAVLARNSGRIVTKERLIEEIWDGRMILDDAIYSQIKALRRMSLWSDTRGRARLYLA